MAEMMKRPTSRSARGLVVDIILGLIGVWLVIDGVRILSTLVFCGGNLMTLLLFRIPGRKGVPVHGQPWELPIALLFFSILFLWPALIVMGRERWALGVLNLLVLVAVRVLFALGEIQANATMKRRFGETRTRRSR